MAQLAATLLELSPVSSLHSVASSWNGSHTMLAGLLSADMVPAGSRRKSGLLQVLHAHVVRVFGACMPPCSCPRRPTAPLPVH